MCLAIYKPKGVQIARKSLLNGFENNNDGCGFVYPKNNRLIFEREFKTFGEFYSTYRAIENKNPMLIHFRLATHGSKSLDNTHPIPFGDGRFALIHNGVINSIKCVDDKSDTVTYAERVLAPMLQRVEFSHPALKYLVETSIGSGNKFVIMRSDGKVNIFNEAQGQWHKGAWFSNSGFKSDWSRTRKFGGGLISSYWTKLTGDADEDETDAELALIEEYSKGRNSYVTPKYYGDVTHGDCFPDYNGSNCK